MRINVVTMNSVKKESKIKAFVSIEMFLDDGGALKLNDLKVVEGPNGLFVGMPSKSYQDSKGNTVWTNSIDFNDQVHKLVTDRILEVYNSGSGLEKPTLGIKKSFKKESLGSTDVFPQTQPLIANRSSASLNNSNDEDIPF